MSAAFEAFDGGIQRDVYTGLSMDAVVKGRDLRRDGARHDPAQRFKNGDVEPQFDGDGRDLKTDITAADNHETIAGGEARAQRIHIRDAAQIENAVDASALDRDPPHARAAREQKLVVRNRIAV